MLMMKKGLLVAGLLLGALSVSIPAGLPSAVQVAVASEPIRFRVEVIEDRARVRELEYKSYEQKLREVEDEANMMMVPAAEKESLLAGVPKGGMLDAHVLGATWEMANGPNWTYVIVDEAGHELYRSNGGNYIKPASVYESRTRAYRTPYGIEAYRTEAQVPPQKTPWGESVYVVHDRLDIPVVLPDRFRVYMIDGINKKRSVFNISKR